MNEFEKEYLTRVLNDLQYLRAFFLSTVSKKSYRDALVDSLAIVVDGVKNKLNDTDFPSQH